MCRPPTKPWIAWLLLSCGACWLAACSVGQHDAESTSGAAASLAPGDPQDPPADPPVEECGCACDCPDDLECRTRCVPMSRGLVSESGQLIEEETELVCDMRCVPAGACAFDDECPAGEMCLPFLRAGEGDALGGSNWNSGGVCAPPPPETCITDEDCAWYGQFTGDTGDYRCLSGICTSDPSACDDDNPCPSGNECKFDCWEGGTGSFSDADDTMGHIEAGCNPVGTCVPEGMCRDSRDCTGGLACRRCTFTGSDPDRPQCEDFGECVVPPVELCQADGDCLANGWYPVEQGRCFSGYCRFDAAACDELHPCGSGLVCDMRCFEGCISTVPAEEVSDTGRCEETETFCEEVGVCMPPDACRFGEDCGEGEMCLYEAGDGTIAGDGVWGGSFSYGYCEPYDPGEPRPDGAETGQP